MRLRLSAAGLVLVFSLGMLGLALITDFAPAAYATGESGTALASEIVEITPVVGPGDDIVVSVEVRNEGEEKIEDGALELRFRSAQLISRSAVEMWEEPDGDVIDPLREAGAPVLQVSLSDLEPGEQQVEELRISTDKIYLPANASQWGPRGLAVDTKIGSDIVQRERTLIIWFPTTAQALYPTQVSVLVPLAGTPPGGMDGAAQGERIDKILNGTRDVDISYALDPYLLHGEETEVTSAHLREVLLGREIFALPEFDADMSALAHLENADAELYLRDARDQINSALEVSSSDVLLWPDGNADIPLADLAAQQETHGVGAIIAGPTQLSPSAALTYTPTGKTRVLTEAGSVSALIPDEEMSITLTAAATDGVQTSTVRARQRLLADSAVITQERPADPRHVLITVPRNWNPDPQRAEELLGTLSDAPWVEMEAVRTLLGAPVDEFERDPLPPYQAGDAEITAELLVSAKAAQELLSTFRSIVSNPDSVLPHADQQLTAIVSNGWKPQWDEREELVQKIARQVGELEQQISVIPAGAVNLITDAGEIPVLINNEFSQDVTVFVRLATDSSFLKTTETVLTELPAQSETSVLIPVEGIGNRDVDVAVHLETESGEQIGAPQTITVRVRAGWEDAGTRAAGAVLVVLFVIGIFRTVKRARKRTSS